MRASTSFLLGVMSALCFSVGLIFLQAMLLDLGWSAPQSKGHPVIGGVLMVAGFVGAVFFLVVEIKPEKDLMVGGFPSRWVSEYSDITLIHGIGSAEAQKYRDDHASEHFIRFADGYDQLRIRHGRGDVTKPRETTVL